MRTNGLFGIAKSATTSKAYVAVALHDGIPKQQNKQKMPCLTSAAVLFFKIILFEKFFTIRVPNSLDPDQAGQITRSGLTKCRPDPGPNCISWLLENRQNKDLITNGSIMKVESIAECYPWGILQYF